MKLFCQNYGCKLNLAELQEIKLAALRLGYILTNQISEADLILVNSCNVTQTAFSKIEQFVKKNHQTKRKIIITGCLPPRFNQEKNENFFIVPSAQKGTIPQLLQKIIDQSSDTNSHPDFRQIAKTRSFIKIQTGCNTRCTYCIIPYQRGRSRSFSPVQITNQIKEYIGQGYQEIVLTGTNLGQYNYHDKKLPFLIEYIFDHVEIPRLRISSIDVCDIDNQLLNLYQKYSKIICPHFHLALQSGSDKILQAMKRPYNISKYRKVVDDIRMILPSSTITTDIIVGFPGEIMSDILSTQDFIREMQFLKVHLFSYSDHSLTPSSHLPDKVSVANIKKRYHLLSQTANQVRKNILLSQIKQNYSILVEKTKKNDQGKNIYRGYSSTYIPVKIISKKTLLANNFYDIKIEKYESGELIGIPIYN